MNTNNAIAGMTAAALGAGTLALVVPAAVAAGPAPAAAKATTVAAVTPAAYVSAREVEREKEGRGRLGTTWEFNLEKEGKRIDVDVDLESRRAGEKWDIRLYHNGKRVTKVVRSTDHEGEVSLDRLVKNKKGKDTLKFRAKSSRGELITSTIKI